jgi:ABC-type uncharacterized transport system substrate-binding protein
MRRHLSTFVLLALLATGPAWAQAVVAVLGERSASFEETLQALRAELAREGGSAELALVDAAALGQNRMPAARLLVALGTDACAAAVRATASAPAASVPVLCTLLPRASFERILHESGRRPSAQLSAIYLNQSPTRQLDLVRLALPQARRIGMLWGQDNQGSRVIWEAAAQSRGLQVVSAVLAPEEPVFQGLRRVVEEADLLLAVASPQIYNAQTIQNILLTSFRARVPMLAFSPAYVRAGALLAIYTPLAELGRQAGRWTRGVLQGQPLPPPQHPAGFEIMVNDYVARSLGLRLDAADLSERLRRLERGS